MPPDTERAERAVIYARISHDATGESLGVRRQTADCHALAEKHGSEIVGVFDDNDISAYSGHRRPGYEAMLELIQDGQVDVVYCWHMDRLHRSMMSAAPFYEACKTHNVSVRAVQGPDLDLSTAAGELTANILTAVASNESRQKSERISRARQQHAEMGRQHGPLGWGYNNRNQIIPEQAEVIREVALRVLDGDTLFSIASDLNERGIPTPGAGSWRWQHVRRAKKGAGDWIGLTEADATVVVALTKPDKLTKKEARALVRRTSWTDVDADTLLEHLTSDTALTEGQTAKLLTQAGATPPQTTWRASNIGVQLKRGALCGWRDFGPGGRGGGPMVAKGDWAPILAKETVDEVRKMLDDPSRFTKGRRPRHYLSGILRCAVCGARMSGQTNSRTGSRSYSCTMIPDTGRCGANTVTAEPVEERVTAAILEVLSDAAFRSRKRRLASTEELKEAEAELSRLDTEEAEWQGDLRAGLIDRPTFMNALDGIRERRKPLEKLIGAASPEVTRALAGAPVERSEVEAWWDAADVEQRRRVARALIDHVTIRKATRRGNTFDPSRIDPPVWRA